MDLDKIKKVIAEMQKKKEEKGNIYIGAVLKNKKKTDNIYIIYGGIAFFIFKNVDVQELKEAGIPIQINEILFKQIEEVLKSVRNKYQYFKMDTEQIPTLLNLENELKRFGKKKSRGIEYNKNCVIKLNQYVLELKDIHSQSVDALSLKYVYEMLDSDKNNISIWLNKHIQYPLRLKGKNGYAVLAPCYPLAR